MIGDVAVAAAHRGGRTPLDRMVGAGQRPVPPVDGRVVPGYTRRPFGYIDARLISEASELSALRATLQRYAHDHGLQFGSVYVDRPGTAPVSGDRVGSAFTALMASIERYSVERVLVPVRAHVRPIGPSKQDHIEHYTNAIVEVALP